MVADRLVTIAAILSLGAVALAADGYATAPHTELPDFDIRWVEIAGRSQAGVSIKERDAAKFSPSGPARFAAVPGHARVVPHALWKTPRYVGSTFGYLSGKQPGGDAAEVVADFIDANAVGFGFDGEAVRRSPVTRRFVSRNGVQHLTFQQQFDDLDVFGQQLRVSLTSSNEIISVSGSFVPDTVLRAPEPFLIDARSAVQAAVASLGGQIAAHQPVPYHGKQAEKTSQPASIETDGLAGRVETSRVYFPMADGLLEPAWHVVIPQGGTANIYEMVVDARDARVLWRWNRTYYSTSEDASFRIYAADSPGPWSPGSDVPDGTQPPFAFPELTVVTPAQINGTSPDGWIDDGDNETIGNNVDAHTDLDGNNQPDLPRPSGDPYRVFDFLSNPLQEDPGDYSLASVVQLFYLCNRFHDRLYELGFDEEAGNFQHDNFAAGGVGGDRIQADAQDPLMLNTASFSTGTADGSQARIQMHVFSNPSPARDSSLDAEMVFHELAHGVSTRLVGPLSGPQPRALAEGWSDFLALALNAEESDNPHGTYAFGAYVGYERWPAFVDNYYFGLRRFPYSTDAAKNPLTYADIDPAQQSFPESVQRNPHPGNLASDPYNAGQVWCNTLMECRATLIDTYGFAGNQIMLQLVIEGMMLTAADPDFLRARDAILQADLLINGGANLDLLWSAFAARGLGFSAASPTTGVSGITEAFDVPTTLFFSYPDGLPSLRPAGQVVSVSVNINALNGATPVPGSGQLVYSVDGGAPVTIPMTSTGPNSYTVDLPATTGCPGRLDYYFSVEESTLGTLLDPPTAPDDVYRLVTAIGVGSVFDDDFSLDNGWIAGAAGDTATAGIWTRVNPVGTLDGGQDPVQPEDDHTPGGDTKCFVTGQGSANGGVGDADVDAGATSLLSPVFDAGGGDLLISYWRWYSNDAGQNPSADTFRVYVSNNAGANWTLVEVVGPDGPENSGGWFYHQFFVSDFLPPTTSVRVRFVAEDAALPSLVEAAIDDVAVTKFYCDTTSPGDGDGNGSINLADHGLFMECLAGPEVSPAPLLPQTTSSCLNSFDLDVDGDVDTADAAVFLMLISAGE